MLHAGYDQLELLAPHVARTLISRFVRWSEFVHVDAPIVFLVVCFDSFRLLIKQTECK